MQINFTTLFSKIVKYTARLAFWKDTTEAAIPTLLEDKTFRDNAVAVLCRCHFDQVLHALLAQDRMSALAKTRTACGEAYLKVYADSVRDTEIPQIDLDILQYATQSTMAYAQEGEDIIISRLLQNQRSGPGFFLDIGAYHPVRFSNTYTLYRAGWRGMNVDAAPGSMDLFRKLRPRDINVECAVSDKRKPLLFHIFEDEALNTFDESLAAEYIIHGWRLTRTVEIVPRPLSALLDEYLPGGQVIDLMNIDVEGEEMGVLMSNDWNRYIPAIIIIELLKTPLEHLRDCPVIDFLAARGYVPMAKLLNSVILQREA